MSIETISEQITFDIFKTKYFRIFTNFFSYEKWNENTEYVIDDIIYYENNMKIYNCIQNCQGEIPLNNTSYWTLNNDLSLLNYITETDFDNAKLYAINEVNDYILKTDFLLQQGLYLLIAHYIFLNINQASLLKNRETFSSILTSRSIEGSSDSRQINDIVIKNTNYDFSRSGFGIEYQALLEKNNFQPFLMMSDNEV